MAPRGRVCKEGRLAARSFECSALAELSSQSQLPGTGLRGVLGNAPALRAPQSHLWRRREVAVRGHVFPTNPYQAPILLSTFVPLQLRARTRRTPPRKATGSSQETASA